MALLLNYPEGHLTIYKFKEIGLVPLCAEVARFIETAEDIKYHVNSTKATFHETDENYEIRFPYLDGS